MKKLIFIALFILAASSFKQAGAQVRVNVNVNIGSQPNWGPAGYDYAEYYYLPDIEVYYYIPTRQFIYLSGSNWVFTYSLPSRYRSYNLYTGYKVVVNEPGAYQYYSAHKVKYARYRGNHSQVIIRNSNDPKYSVVKGHPKYKKSKNNHGRGHRHH